MTNQDAQPVGDGADDPVEEVVMAESTAVAENPTEPAEVDAVVALPEVEGPNSFPTNGRFDTSTANYAAGWPATPVVTESARRARQKLQGV